MKKPVFKLDRAGLFVEGLGLSLHVHWDPRAAGEPFAWASEWSRLGRQFRLGGLAGAVSRV